MKKIILIFLSIFITGFLIFLGINEYNYSKKVTKEDVTIIIPFWENDKKDTIVESFQIDMFKYYSHKKIHIFWSDCTTCGSQNYSFYKKPTIETLNEKDTINHDWIDEYYQNRKIDSVVLSINFPRVIDRSELDENNKRGLEEIGRNHLEKLKIENPNTIILKNEVEKIGNYKFSVIEYQLNNINYNYAIFYLKDNNIVWIRLVDYTNSKEIKSDFYKMLASIKE